MLGGVMRKPQALIAAGVITLALAGLYAQTVVQQRAAAADLRQLRNEFREAQRVSQERIRRLEALLKESERLSEEQKREFERLRTDSPRGPGDFPISRPRPFIDPSKNAPRRE